MARMQGGGSQGRRRGSRGWGGSIRTRAPSIKLLSENDGEKKLPVRKFKNKETTKERKEEKARKGAGEEERVKGTFE